MVLRRQKAPVEVATLADGNRCPVFRHHLHPGGRIYLKIKVGVVIWAKVWPIQLKCLVTQCLKLAKRASLTLLSRPSSRTSTPGWETFVSWRTIKWFEKYIYFSILLETSFTYSRVYKILHCYSLHQNLV
jgi:hypothetical protein